MRCIDREQFNARRTCPAWAFAHKSIPQGQVHKVPFQRVPHPPEVGPESLLTMSYMKTKTKTKSKKEIVLDGDNQQDYAEWETEAKFQIKAKLGAIGLEHFQGSHDYSLSEER